jgi:hypothetical protein
MKHEEREKRDARIVLMHSRGRSEAELSVLFELSYCRVHEIVAAATQRAKEAICEAR